MPSPQASRPVANRKGGLTTPAKKKLDIGQPLGPHDTASVRERVRRWQEQGGGVVTASDICVEEEEEQVPEVEEDITIKKAAAAAATCAEKKESVKSKERESRPSRTQTSARDGPDPTANRHRSHTPKRRVVSDEHWKKNRSTPKLGTEEDESRPREERRRRRKESSGTIKEETTPKGSPKTYDNDGIRVYATPPSSRQTSAVQSGAKDDDNSDLQTIVEDDRRAKSPVRSEDGEDARNTTTPEVTPEASDKKDARRQSLRNSPSERRPKPTGNRGSLRIHKGGLLSNIIDLSKELFTAPEAPPAPAPKPSKVEAWLEDTPDPYEENSVDVPPASFVGAPKSEAGSDAIDSSQAASPTPTDPNAIWDDVGKKEVTRDDSLRRRRKRRAGHSKSMRLSSRPLATDFAPESSKSEEKPAPKSRRSSLQYSESAYTETEAPPSDIFTIKAEEMDKPEPLSMRRRNIPTRGRKPLSTIFSVDTSDAKSQAPSVGKENAIPESTLDADEKAEARDHFDPDSMSMAPSQLKRRLTNHSDLMSVLSMPGGRSKSIRSARSIRTNRSRLEKATVADLLKELSTDEEKYLRELRTLVDGVIPVLLSCVLSKTDSTVAAGLFGPAASNDDVSYSKPIVQMGVALERLKALHKRIPLNSVTSLLTWAQGAQRVYTEYLKSWRLGFQDVVVNLAPPEEPRKTVDGSTLDDGMSLDENGDVIGGDGDKVDVAYLLKRPLVRLKYLSKTFKGINVLEPSPNAAAAAEKYQELVVEARRRTNEERARLEDDAAAAIDPTRCRDPKTMAVLAGVTVDKTRKVRARDVFNLGLHHSSGQWVDCRSELLLRDDAPGRGNGGDLLIAEVGETGRWLLFPPIEIGRLSARKGETAGELVVMIRGFASGGREWRELLSLQQEDEQAAEEWVQLLGDSPVPPAIESPSFGFKDLAEPRSPVGDSNGLTVPTPTTPTRSRAPSPREVDVPFGEQASVIFDRGSSPTTSRPTTSHSRKSHNQESLLSLQTGSQVSAFTAWSDSRATSSDDARASASAPASPSSLRRSRAHRRSRSRLSTQFASSETNLPLPKEGPSLAELASQLASSVAIDEKDVPPSPTLPEPASPTHSSTSKETTRPARYHRRQSTVPDPDLAAESNIDPAPPASPVFAPPEAIPEPKTPPSPSKWASFFGRRGDTSSPSKLQKPNPIVTKDIHEVFADDLPSPVTERPIEEFEPTPPKPPPHRSPSPGPVPKLEDAPIIYSPKTPSRLRKRSSSPLKHEYEPSTATESSDTDSTESSDTETDSDSEYDPLESEERAYGDVVPELPLIRGDAKRSPPVSHPSTLAPSNSASQAPYHRVPPQPEKSNKTVASIFRWSDSGSWESLHQDICNIVVSPGMIEAYEIETADSKRSSRSRKPLVALELTPIVLLRRGTALDISIRSPPTDASRLKKIGNNIMFRSPSPAECEALYLLVNHARINNPTYIALQNARGPYMQIPGQGGLARHSSGRGRPESGSTDGSGWFGVGRRNSYRASKIAPPSIGMSDSSVGSMSSAFSALRRFGAGSRMFSLSRSTVTSREGSGQARSLFSDETLGSGTTGSGRSGATTPADLGEAPVEGIGLTNTKIRLYVRESSTKWQDLGSARMTVMPSADDSVASGKRIFISNKDRGKTLLDVTLSEQHFERIGRTGIAINVWEEVGDGEGGVKKEGGVMVGMNRVYMVQMKGEAEAAYMFGLVGRLRY